MADIDGRYFQVPLEGAVAQRAPRSRCFKLSAALFGMSCVVLAFLVAISVVPVGHTTSEAGSEAASLFSLASRLRPKLAHVPWTAASMNAQRDSLSQSGVRQPTPSLRTQALQVAEALLPEGGRWPWRRSARAAVVAQESPISSRTQWGVDPAKKLNLMGGPMQQCGYDPSDSSILLPMGYRVFRRATGYCDALCVSVNQEVPQREKNQRSAWWERDTGNKAPPGKWCLDPTDFAQAASEDPETAVGFTINCDASDGALRDYFENGMYLLAYRRQEEAKDAMTKIRETCDGEVPPELPREQKEKNLYSELLYVDPITGEEIRPKERIKEDWERARKPKPGEAQTDTGGGGRGGNRGRVKIG